MVLPPGFFFWLQQVLDVVVSLLHVSVVYEKKKTNFRHGQIFTSENIWTSNFYLFIIFFFRKITESTSAVDVVVIVCISLVISLVFANVPYVSEVFTLIFSAENVETPPPSWRKKNKNMYLKFRFFSSPVLFMYIYLYVVR